MHKPFRFGFVLGRFQHLHAGHQRMIEAGLNTCDTLLVLVGSSQESSTRKNPFNLKTRMDLLRNVYNEEVQYGKLLLGHIDDMTTSDDDSLEWGDYVLNKVDTWKQHYSIDNHLDCMIYGSDAERNVWYSPDRLVDISKIILSRHDDAITATEMRRFLVEDKYKEWEEHVPESISFKTHFKTLQKEILEVPHYKEMHEQWLKL